MQNILLVGLANVGRERLEGGEEVVGDREGYLLFGRESLGECDLVELCRAVQLSATCVIHSF